MRIKWTLSDSFSSAGETFLTGVPVEWLSFRTLFTFRFYSWIIDGRISQESLSLTPHTGTTSVRRPRTSSGRWCASMWSTDWPARRPWSTAGSRAPSLSGTFTPPSRSNWRRTLPSQGGRWDIRQCDLSESRRTNFKNFFLFSFCYYF